MKIWISSASRKMGLPALPPEPCDSMQLLLRDIHVLWTGQMFSSALRSPLPHTHPHL